MPAPALDRRSTAATRTSVIGSADLTLIHLVLEVPARRPHRERLARTVALTLEAAGLRPEAVTAEGDGILVELGVRLGDPESSSLPGRLRDWRRRLGSVTRIPGPSPVSSISELVHALAFDDDVDPTEPLSAELLTSAPIEVYLAGGGSEAASVARDLERLHGDLVRALRPQLASPRLDSRIVVPSWRTGGRRRWVTIPGLGSSHFHAVRALPEPDEPTMQLARVIANSLFGGMRCSLLPEAVRGAGLSYSPTAALVRVDGRHAIVIEVPVAVGSELAVDQLVTQTVDEFGTTAWAAHMIEVVRRQLVGRTIVDTDSARGAIAVARLGSDFLPFSDPRALGALLDDVPDDLVRQTAADLYRAEDFDELVISPRQRPSGWEQL